MHHELTIFGFWPQTSDWERQMDYDYYKFEYQTALFISILMLNWVRRSNSENPKKAAR